MIKKRIIISDYVRFRAYTRGFDIEDIESIVKHTAERYFDVETRRVVAIGRCSDKLVVIPYEESDEAWCPCDRASCHSAANPVSGKHYEICI